MPTTETIHHPPQSHARAVPAGPDPLTHNSQARGPRSGPVRDRNRAHYRKVVAPNPRHAPPLPSSRHNKRQPSAPIRPNATTTLAPDAAVRHPRRRLASSATLHANRVVPSQRPRHHPPQSHARAVPAGPDPLSNDSQARGPRSGPVRDRNRTDNRHIV